MILKAIYILVISYTFELRRYLCQLEDSENGFRIANDIIKLVKPPRDILGATPGSRVQFECLAYPSSAENHTPAIGQIQPLLVAWLKDGKNISINNGKAGSDDESHYFTTQKATILIINPVTWQHEGRYQCAILHTKFGVVLSPPARLILREMPCFIMTGKNTSVRAGENVKLPCRATGHPKPVIKWYRNEEPISLENVEIRQRYNALPTGDLKITSFNVTSDQGVYFCSAANDVGEIFSPKALISTSSTHESLSDFRNTKLPSARNPISLNFLTSSSIGERVYLECMSDPWNVSLTSYPNYSVHWSREDKIPLKSSSRVFAQDLEIPNINEDDNATYICTIQSEDPPAFRTVPSMVLEHRGGGATFSCNVYGNPEPNITWFKDGEPVKILARVKVKVTIDFLKTIPYPNEAQRKDVSVMGKTFYMRDLMISSLKFEEDVGIYQCFASNSLGEITAAAPLAMFPTGPDDDKNAPRNFRAFVSQNERKIKMAWSVSQGTFSYYIVHYYSTNVSTGSNHHFENSEAVEVQRYCRNGTCTYYCCDNTALLPFTFYTFWVTGLGGGARSSAPSESIVLRTRQEAVTSIVHTLTATPCLNNKDSLSCVHLTWKRPNESSVGGIISEYRIEYIEDDVLNELYLHPAGNETEIQNLKPGRPYLFRVIPKTLAGYPTQEALHVLGRSFPFVHYTTPSMAIQSLPPPFIVKNIRLENISQSEPPTCKVVLKGIVKSKAVFDKLAKNCRVRFGSLDSALIKEEIFSDIVDLSFNESDFSVIAYSRPFSRPFLNVFYQTTVECDLDGDSSADFSFVRVLHLSTFGDLNLTSTPIVPDYQFSATVDDLKCSLLIDNTKISYDSTVNSTVILNWHPKSFPVIGYDIKLWINDKSYREILIQNITQNRLVLKDVSPQNLAIKFAIRSIYSSNTLSWFTEEKICNFPPNLENFTIRMPDRIDITVLNQTAVNLTFDEPRYLNMIIAEQPKDEYLLYKVRYGKNVNRFDEIRLPNLEQKLSDRVTLVLENLEPGSSYKLNIAAPDKLGRWGPFSHDCLFQTPLSETRTVFQCYSVSSPNHSSHYRFIVGFCLLFIGFVVCLLVCRICCRRNGTTRTNSKFCLLNFLSKFRHKNNDMNDKDSKMERLDVEITPVKYGNATSIVVQNGIDIDKPLLENGYLVSERDSNALHMQNGRLIEDQSSVLISEM